MSPTASLSDDGSTNVKRVHIIGGKNHGKTTLVAQLVEELTLRKLRVGTIKHTHHEHELDTPGKDSHRHREAGASVIGILSRQMNALFWPPEESPEADQTDRYEQFAPMYAQCDLVIVEGDTLTDGLKIEVWRAERNTRPLAELDPSIAAVVTDDPLSIETACWPRSDVSAVADKILSLLDG
jgi:molybdopterin-guanine dinucleotide biosynthesis protein B